MFVILNKTYFVNFILIKSFFICYRAIRGTKNTQHIILIAIVKKRYVFIIIRF